MMHNRDWDVQITNAADVSRRFRLLNTETGKAWRVGEMPITPQIPENSAHLSFDSLPPERFLSFAMDDWIWGTGLQEFIPGRREPSYTARYSSGHGIDTSVPGRIRHGPEVEVVGDVSATPLQFIEFDDKVYIITNARLWTWDGTTLASVNATSTNKAGAVVFNSLLYVPRGATYVTWDTSTLSTISEAVDLFLVQDNKLWRAHSTNKISFQTVATGTWDSDIVIGNGAAITNMFLLSGLLFVTTEEAIYVVDSVGQPHELDELGRTAKSSGNFKHKGTSGTDAWLSNGFSQDLYRIIAVGLEEFRIQRDGPGVTGPILPVNNNDLLKASSTLSAFISFDAVYVRINTTDGALIMKGIEMGGGINAWTPIWKIDATAANGGDVIGVFQLAGEDSPYVYVGTSTSSTDVQRIPCRDWPADNVDYVTTWEWISPFYQASLATWDKVWWRFKHSTEAVGAGTTATVSVFARISPSASWTSISASHGTGEVAVSLPSSFAGKRVQLRFVGTAGNSNQDGIDIRSFSLEGILKPENLPVYDFTVIARNKADANFLKALRTETDSMVLKDSFDIDQTVFMLPGSPTERELIDESLKESVRTYRILAQNIPAP